MSMKRTKPASIKTLVTADQVEKARLELNSVNSAIAEMDEAVGRLQVQSENIKEENVKSILATIQNIEDGNFKLENGSASLNATKCALNAQITELEAHVNQYNTKAYDFLNNENYNQLKAFYEVKGDVASELDIVTLVKHTDLVTEVNALTC